MFHHLEIVEFFVCRHYIGVVTNFIDVNVGDYSTFFIEFSNGLIPAPLSYHFLVLYPTGHVCFCISDSMVHL